MAEKEESWHLIRSSRGDALVLLVTFGLVVFRDLTEGIIAGFALGGLLFIARMSESSTVAAHDGAEMTEQSDGRVVYRLSGPYFFGAAAKLGSVLDTIASSPQEFVLDLTDVPMIDSSGARSFLLLARKMARRGGRLVILGARPAVHQMLVAQGAASSTITFRDTAA